MNPFWLRALVAPALVIAAGAHRSCRVRPLHCLRGARGWTLGRRRVARVSTARAHALGLRADRGAGARRTRSVGADVCRALPPRAPAQRSPARPAPCARALRQRRRGTPRGRGGSRCQEPHPVGQPARRGAPGDRLATRPAYAGRQPRAPAGVRPIHGRAATSTNPLCSSPRAKAPRCCRSRSCRSASRKSC